MARHTLNTSSAEITPARGRGSNKREYMLSQRVSCHAKAPRSRSPATTSYARVPRTGLSVQDRNFNRGWLSIGPGALLREPRCAGDGAPATASACRAGRSACGPGGDPGPAGTTGPRRWARWARRTSPRGGRGALGGAYSRGGRGVGGRACGARRASARGGPRRWRAPRGGGRGWGGAGPEVREDLSRGGRGQEPVVSIGLFPTRIT